MKVIFGIAFLTAKDIDAINARIEAAECATGRNEYRIAKLNGGLTNFADKFATAMDFIGRNLPLKRKRKAFRKIVDAYIIMVLKVLGSSSQGNSYILENDREALLLEAGVKFASVKQALDYNITKVVGCLITHEHKDHAGYINEVLKATVPVYASAGTIENTPIEGPRRPHICQAGTLLTLGGFRIIPFGTKHDSAEPLGFFINHEETGNILFATDTYYLPCKFAGLNNVLIECNYRLDILDANIAAGRIPAVVRNRTLKSHFSYDHCVQALQANDMKGVNNIVLIHLSDGNSNAEQFRAGVRAATGKTVHIAEAGLTINFNKTPF